MGLLEARRGLVFGIANDRSIACHVAARFRAEGAECGYPCLPGEKNERRARKALEEIGITDPWLLPCDVTLDEDIDRAFEQVRARFDSIDFVVHSLAYADRAFLKPGKFVYTPRDVFAEALDMSSFSLGACARRAKAMLHTRGAFRAIAD